MCYYDDIKCVGMVGFAPTRPLSHSLPKRTCLLFHHSPTNTLPLLWLATVVSISYTGRVGRADTRRSFVWPAIEVASSCLNLHYHPISFHNVRLILEEFVVFGLNVLFSFLIYNSAPSYSGGTLTICIYCD
jgi:hypothetical protein